jgi:hypothetical protein
MTSRQRPRRINNPKSNRGVLIAAMILVIFTGAFLKVRNDRKAALAALPVSGPAGNERGPRKAKLQMAAKETVPKTNLKSKTSSNVRAEQQAGLKSAGYVIGEMGQKSLRLELKLQPVCHKGDLEAMAALVGVDGEVLVSIEQVAGGKNGNSKAVTRLISLGEIRKGATVDLQVEDDQRGIYGIFICSDQSGTKSCSGKEPADFDALLANGGRSKTDSVFYFQIAALKSTSAVVFAGDITALQRAKTALMGDAEFSGSNIDKAWQAGAAYTRQVQSLPPTTVPSQEFTAFAIPIAALSESACGQEN